MAKCFLERRCKIVKQIEKRFWVYILEMAAFSAILLFDIFYGSQHPNLFLWGLMGLFAIIIAIELVPTKKDVVILLVGMAALAIWGTLVDKLVNYLFGEHFLLCFIASLVLMAPVYFPLFFHFCRICQKAAQRMKRELSEHKNN